ncbi:MAG: hypothetical protein ACLFN8_00840 [Candidatus Woesearchaeota archaeon]
MNYPNLNYIVEALSNTYSVSQIGQIFSESLTRRKLDSIAYFNRENVQNNVKVKKVQGKVISNLKAELIVATFKPYTFSNTDFRVLKFPNENSLLGCVKTAIDLKGEDAFEDIGQAVLKGSEIYLMKEPLAKYMNSFQFKEYTSIQAELQKIH